MNWNSAVLSLALGILVGAIVYASGVAMDHYRDRRWRREMEERPPLPVRIPRKRPEDGDGA